MSRVTISVGSPQGGHFDLVNSLNLDNLLDTAEIRKKNRTAKETNHGAWPKATPMAFAVFLVTCLFQLHLIN